MMLLSGLAIITYINYSLITRPLFVFQNTTAQAIKLLIRTKKQQRGNNLFRLPDVTIVK